MWLIIKKLIFLSPLLLLSCTNASKEKDIVIDISEDLAQIKKDATSNFYSEDLIKLPNRDKVISDIIIGNKTPFYPDNSITKSILNNDLKLTGILSTKKKLLAFVKYKNNSGVLEIGDIGGIDTNLLPKDYKSISIDQSQGKLTIQFRNDIYILKIFNESEFL